VRASDFVGRRVPAYCTASGRALLIDHDTAALKVLMGAGRLPPAGPDAPRTAVDLARRIELARESGFAVAQEELEPGLVAVAAPVRDFRGAVVAALNVSAPQFRFQARLPAAGEQTRQAADQLSHELGFDRRASDSSPNGHPTPISRRAS
jgi:DNA-binding IclR family transcriptional regulator